MPRNTPRIDTSGVQLFRIIRTDVPGTLLSSGARHLQRRAHRRLGSKKRCGSHQLTLDTSELSFIDSQGLRMLILGE